MSHKIHLGPDLIHFVRDEFGRRNSGLDEHHTGGMDMVVVLNAMSTTREERDIHHHQRPTAACSRSAHQRTSISLPLGLAGRFKIRHPSLKLGRPPLGVRRQLRRIPAMINPDEKDDQAAR